MTLAVDYFDNDINLVDDKVFTIEIENKKYFFRFINDLYNLSSNNYIEDLNLFDNNKEVINKKIHVFINFLDFDFNSRKYSNDLIKYISKNLEDEERNDLLKLYNKLSSYYNKILHKMDLPLTLDTIDINNIIKNIKVKIDSKNDLLNNIFLLIDLEKILNTYNILVFINLKQYLSQNELIELYKYSIYNQVNIILVDSQSYGIKLDYEKKLIIDVNLEEFML